MNEANPIEIFEYGNVPKPIEIPIEKLEKFYLDFKEKLKIKPKYEKYKKFKERITEHNNFNPSNNMFKLKLKAKYYIGILKLPNNQTIIIRPKVGEDIKFIKMLEYVDPQYAHIYYEISQKITPETNFLSILVDRFISSAERLIKTSLIKNYKIKRNRGTIIRGKILQKETMQNPNFLKGLVVCEYNDYTPDIIENQIIKLALNNLRYIADENQQVRIRQLLVEIQDITLKDFKIEDIERIKYNHLNSRYKKIHDYCKLIIGNFSFGFEVGKNEWFSMLLNSWDIYERFIRQLFNIFLKELMGKNISVKKKKIGQWNSCDKQKLIPDILIKQKNEILLLIDAKYKLRFKIGDYHQGRTYLHEILKKHKRCEVNFNKNHRNLLLIYPVNFTNEYNFLPIEKDPIKKSGIVYAHSIDLYHIDNDSYLRSWVKRIYKKFLK
ncbi:MAG: hypothetical protein JXA99_08360 [Candidatus Lokiarchaeota archaeon]|nr:hypothetical protein [Candidatus Lokiarchaeota archaeon]